MYVCVRVSVCAQVECNNSGITFPAQLAVTALATAHQEAESPCNVSPAQSSGQESFDSDMPENEPPETAQTVSFHSLPCLPCTYVFRALTQVELASPIKQGTKHAPQRSPGMISVWCRAIAVGACISN